MKNLFDVNYTHGQIKGLVNSFSSTIVTINFIAPVLVAYVLLPFIDLKYLATWLVMYFCAIWIRIYVGNNLKTALIYEDKKRIEKSLNYYLLIIFLAGILWGTILSAAILASNETFVFFFLTLLFALSSASILTLGTIFIAVFLFNISMVLPAVISFCI